MIDHLAEFRVEQDKISWEQWRQTKLPTVEQLMRLREVADISSGDPINADEAARLILIALLNKDFILGYDRQ